MCIECIQNKQHFSILFIRHHKAILKVNFHVTVIHFDRGWKSFEVLKIPLMCCVQVIFLYFDFNQLWFEFDKLEFELQMKNQIQLLCETNVKK